MFGVVPLFGEPADLINCLWYGTEGDYANAAFSCGATLPGLGLAAVAAKWGRRTDGLAGSIRNVNPLGGTQNCVNCVIAGDATLAGRPASALAGGPHGISILERTFGGSFTSVSGRAQIEEMLLSAGPGSRGIVFGGRAGGVGHVFNAINQGGAIRFLDPQIGGPASFRGFTEFRFLWTNTP